MQEEDREISCSAPSTKTTKLVGEGACMLVCGVLSAGKDSSEQEQLMIQPPININADAGCVRAQYPTCLRATG